MLFRLFTADVVQSTIALRERVDENVTTTSKGATAIPQSKSIPKKVNHTSAIFGLNPGISYEVAARYSGDL